MQMNKEDVPPIIRLDETDSTNRYMQQLLAERTLPEGSLVVADFQTAGKGQVGNSWEAERGANLLFSLLLRPDFLPANRQFLISQIASLRVKETLEAYTASIRVKSYFPNPFLEREGNIRGIHRLHPRQVAKRCLLERPQDLRHVDRERFGRCLFAYLRHRHRPERQPAMFPKRRTESHFACADHRAITRPGRGVATFPAHLLRLLHPSASGRRGRHPANVQRSIVSRRRLLSLCRQGGNV